MSDYNIDEVLGFDSKELVRNVLAHYQAGTGDRSFIDPCMRVWDMRREDGLLKVTCEEIGFCMVVERN